MRLLIDANLIVLSIVGSLDTSLIEQHQRTRHYKRRDFTILAEFTAGHMLVVTPNVLTEASNLVVSGLVDPRRSQAREALKTLVVRSDERFIASKCAVERREYIRLGLADAALLVVEPDNSTLLTDDEGLYQAARYTGRAAINFKHLQVER